MTQKSAKRPSFEMYSLFVESSYRVTEWRHSTNNFFLSLNAATIAIAGFGWQEKIPYFDSLVIILALFMFLVCCLWARLLLALKSLNSAKFKVIAEMEGLRDDYEPFTREWHFVKKQSGLLGYSSLSNLELSIVAIIALFHLVAATWIYAYGIPTPAP